jgi:hypothetical protein
MATTKQKSAARKNVKKARTTKSRRTSGTRVARRTGGLSTRQKNKLPAERFAFTKKRKEPITDARHVRNAIARFDQVEGVTVSEREAAWKRIRAAARKFGIQIQVRGWRSLMRGGKTARRR